MIFDASARSQVTQRRKFRGYVEHGLMAGQFQHLEQSGIGSIFLVIAISELLWRPDPVH